MLPGHWAATAYQNNPLFFISMLHAVNKEDAEINQSVIMSIYEGWDWEIKGSLGKNLRGSFSNERSFQAQEYWSDSESLGQWLCAPLRIKLKEWYRVF